MGIIADIMSAPQVIFRTFSGRSFKTLQPPTTIGEPPFVEDLGLTQVGQDPNIPVGGIPDPALAPGELQGRVSPLENLLGRKLTLRFRLNVIIAELSDSADRALLGNTLRGTTTNQAIVFVPEDRVLLSRFGSTPLSVLLSQSSIPALLVTMSGSQLRFLSIHGFTQITFGNVRPA